MDGDGIATDSTGNLYFITGDGTFDVNTGGKDYGDTFVKLSTTGTVLDYFTPSDQAALDSGNLDLGSGGVLLLPTQSGPYPDEMVSAGKNGTVYLVNRDNMGHYNASKDADIQSLTNIFPNTIGDEGGNFSSPVYFNGSVYFSPVGGPCPGFSVDQRVIVDGADVRILGDVQLPRRNNVYFGRWQLERDPLDPPERGDGPEWSADDPGYSPRLRREQPGQRALQQQPGWVTRHARWLGQVQRPGRGEWRGLRCLR